MDNIDRDAKKRLVGSKPAGQSFREFCKENNLREAQYFYWRNKLNKESQPQQDSGPIEGKFKQAKARYGLENIKAKLAATSTLWIATIALVLNLVRMTRQHLCPYY